MNKKVNPKMIVLARESRSLRQSELALGLEINQQAISKIELGFLTVSPDLLSRLVNVLNCPKDFFRQAEDIYPPTISYHRKKRSLSQKELNRISASIDIQRIHVQKLLSSIDLANNNIPYFDIDEYKQQPAEIAKILKQYWGLSNKQPIDNLTEIIEEAGGIIIHFNHSSELFDGCTFLIKDLPPIIFLNSNMPADRLRFTLAHELGHIVMHRIPNPFMEEEADRFAAEFLMPEEGISPAMSEVSLGRLSLLKPYWKVSMNALLKRAVDLNKLNSVEEKYLWTEMARRGFRRKEPENLDIMLEKPKLLKNMIDFYLKNLNYSTGELSKFLCIHKSELEMLYLKDRFNHLQLIKK